MPPAIGPDRALGESDRSGIRPGVIAQRSRSDLDDSLRDRRSGRVDHLAFEGHRVRPADHQPDGIRSVRGAGRGAPVRSLARFGLEHHFGTLMDAFEEEFTPGVRPRGRGEVEPHGPGRSVGKLDARADPVPLAEDSCPGDRLTFLVNHHSPERAPRSSSMVGSTWPSAVISGISIPRPSFR